MSMKRVLLIFCLLQIVWAFEGRPVLDEWGNETGLINLNPDENGEPWIAGGVRPYTLEDRAFIATVPKVELSAQTRSRQLPREIILMENEEFPPVFNQKGGSCAQASGVAYLYSYQINVLEGVKGTSQNIKAYGFTHNYLNGGNNSNGSWYWDGWRILQKVGAPTVTTFHGVDNGGLSGTRWMNGGDRWHKANDNRVDELKTIKVSSMADIEKIKNWMYDLNGADPKKKGGCVVFAANAGTANGNSTVSSGPHAGEPLATGLSGSNMNHAMTFAGYSDDVAGGALLLLNSWGSGWQNGGTVWVPYTTIINGGLYNNEVWCVTTKKHTPKLELKAKVKHGTRNKVKITTGVSNSLNASTPSATKSYGRAFSYDGGAYPMEGMGGSSEIEVSLDVSELYDEITGGDAKFFFIVSSKGGSCTIRDLSLLDYTQGATPVEFFSEDGTVNVNGTAQSTVILNSSPQITVSSPNGGEKIEQYSTYSVTWGDNIDGKVKIELITGAETAILADSTESDGIFEWEVPVDQELGSGYKIVVTSLDDPSITDESDDFFEVAEEFIIKEFPYTENFDLLDTSNQLLSEGWMQSQGDDINWTLWSGPTPSRIGSSPDSTGPVTDVSADGNYLYIEASEPNNPGKSAVVESPKFDIRNIPNPLFTCKVHMFSARKEMGTLQLDICVDGEWKRAVQTIDTDQGDQWIDFEQSLTEYIGERVMFRFTGTTGDSWCSDICIDEIVIDGSEGVAKTTQKIAPQQVVITAGKMVVPLQKRGHYDISLFNMKGRVIYHTTGTSSSANVIVPIKELNLANSIYFCKVKNADITTVVPILNR